MITHLYLVTPCQMSNFHVTASCCSRHWRQNRTRRWATPIQIPTIWTISSSPHAKRKSRTAVSSDFVRQFPRKSSARKGYTPSNTAKNNRWAKSLFLDWLGERNATIRNNGSQKDQTNEMGRLTLLSDGSDEELCTWLSRFLMEVRKTTGEDYPSSTLHNLLCALQRVVRERKKRPKIDFFRDPLYAELRNTIDIVCRSLHGRGVGVEKARTSSICYDEEEALWSKGP